MAFDNISIVVNLDIYWFFLSHFWEDKEIACFSFQFIHDIACFLFTRIWQIKLINFF